MDVFTVALFGHRDIDDLRLLEEKLAPLIKELLRTKEYVAFLIGRNGEFDEFAASVIKRIQKEVGLESSDITLVLPYAVADIEYYEKYYDSIVIPDAVANIHPKRAITVKNRWMVESSDTVIVYVQRAQGGAYTAMRYAQKIGKEVVNLSELTE